MPSCRTYRQHKSQTNGICTGGQRGLVTVWDKDRFALPEVEQVTGAVEAVALCPPNDIAAVHTVKKGELA